MTDHACCSCDRHATMVRHRVGHMATAGALLSVFPIAHAMAPFILRDAIPLCPFRAMTGKPCPLCGLTRAFALATHGRWHEAFLKNPIWPLFVGLFAILASLFAADAISGRDDGGLAVRMISGRWIWIVAALLLFDAWRIACWPG